MSQDIPVSDYPEWLDEDVIEPCPDCGHNNLTKYMRQSVPNDTVWVYECKYCGSTWES